MSEIQNPGKPQSPAAPARSRVLAVDNSPVNLSLVRSTLEPFGFQVSTADTVAEALALARSNPPDLILSDLHMPETDGCDFLKIVKADPQLRCIPFAMISSTVWRETDPTVALSLGAALFILRPVEPAELIAQVQAAIATRERWT